MDVTPIALQSIEQAQVRLEAAATGIASAGDASAGGATVDLSAEVVALLASKNQVSLDAATLKIADQTQKSVLNLLA